MDDKYSVLMSVYYKEKPEYLQQSIESILNQTAPTDDFVLVCDGPLTMELENIIEQLTREWPQTMMILRLPERKGLGIALREGVLACRCEIVARMDSDDIALPQRMELQLAALEKNLELAELGGQIDEFFEENTWGNREVPLSPEKVRNRAAFRNPMNHMTVTFRREAVLAAGNYMDFDRFEDYHLWARMLGQSMKLANLPQVLVRARVNDGTYARRGGWRYFCQSVAMQNHLLHCGLCGPVGWLRNCLIRFLGTVLLPRALRGRIYQTLLRRRDEP